MGTILLDPVVQRRMQAFQFGANNTASTVDILWLEIQRLQTRVHQLEAELSDVKMEAVLRVKCNNQPKYPEFTFPSLKRKIQA